MQLRPIMLMLDKPHEIHLHDIPRCRWFVPVRGAKIRIVGRHVGRRDLSALPCPRTECRLVV